MLISRNQQDEEDPGRRAEKSGYWSWNTSWAWFPMFRMKNMFHQQICSIYLFAKDKLQHLFSFSCSCIYYATRQVPYFWIVKTILIVTTISSESVIKILILIKLTTHNTHVWTAVWPRKWTANIYSGLRCTSSTLESIDLQNNSKGSQIAIISRKIHHLFSQFSFSSISYMVHPSVEVWLAHPILFPFSSQGTSCVYFTSCHPQPCAHFCLMPPLSLPWASSSRPLILCFQFFLHNQLS